MSDGRERPENVDSDMFKLFEETPTLDDERPEDPLGLRAWSAVMAMRNRVRLLQAPTNGTKDQL